VVKKPAYEPKDLITLVDAAAVAQVSVVTIWRWIRDGKLSRIEIGGRPFVRRSQVEKMQPRRVRKRA
jgi:predicted site-specific integrase-resolvase